MRFLFLWSRELEKFFKQILIRASFSKVRYSRMESRRRAMCRAHKFFLCLLNEEDFMILRRRKIVQSEVEAKQFSSIIQFPELFLYRDGICFGLSV